MRSGISLKSLRYGLLLAAVALSLAPAHAADDAPLVLLVQPLQTQEQTTRIYRPLADYIQSLTGRRCTIQTPANFLSYWDAVRRNNYDLALDGSHFTDYRIQKFGFGVLARVPDAVSFSLVVKESSSVRDPAQLVGKRIATLGLLNASTGRLDGIFPNPVRQPVVIEAGTPEEALDLLLSAKVEAALLPTPLVSRRLERGGISVVLTTEPIPHLALSASPRLAAPLAEAIRTGILEAHKNDSGRDMLHIAGLERFEAAPPEVFAKQSNLLKSHWGY